MWEIFIGWFRAKMNQRKGMMGQGSNDSVRPEFDLAEEYLEVMYRQFILYLAFAIIPLAPVLGLICNVVAYRYLLQSVNTSSIYLQNILGWINTDYFAFANIPVDYRQV